MSVFANILNGVNQAGNLIAVGSNIVSGNNTASQVGHFGRTLTRGMLVYKQKLATDYVVSDDFLMFQFNPTLVSDEKVSEYAVRKTPGINENYYIWSNGGERKISFSLMFDATPVSLNQWFNVDADINPNRPIPIDDQVSILRPRGVLDDVEKLNQYLYPQVQKSPTFVANSGVFSGTEQFTPPPIALFVYGPMFMEVVVLSVRTEYTLFNRSLVPLRATCDVTLGVIEDSIVDTTTMDTIRANREKQAGINDRISTPPRSRNISSISLTA